jgi:ABC-2 type transport system ATP-binding protein
MDEVEYLCDAFGGDKPGRIGIMDKGKLISLGTLQQLRSLHGQGLVMKQGKRSHSISIFPDFVRS